MKTTIIAFLSIALALAACAQRDGGDTTTPDGGNGGGTQVDPPAESTSWACRSGVDADGNAYIEFNPGYLHNGSIAMAYIVGDAPGENIVSYFNGSYEQQGKDASSHWYRHTLTGPDGSKFVLTYASQIDKVGTNADAWAQYGSNLTQTVAGPFRWNSSGANYACAGYVHTGLPATPLN